MANKKDMMNVESLFILSTIAKSSGKRQASKEYNISVDTINKYIENLETELGYKVLASNGRGSVITTRAHGLLDKVAKIEDILSDIYSTTPEKKDISGEVRIGMPLMISSNLLPKDLASFFDSYPDLRLISMSAIDSEANEARISNVDIALVTDIPSNSDLVVIASKKIECGFFASPEYLSRYGYPLDLDDMIKNHRLVNKIDNIHTIPMWNNALKKARYLCYSSNSTFALAEVIRYGGGIGVMPLRFKDEGLVCLDNIKCNTDVNFYLVAHKNTKDIPRIRTVLNYYKDLLASM